MDLSNMIGRIRKRIEQSIAGPNGDVYDAMNRISSEMETKVAAAVAAVLALAYLLPFGCTFSKIIAERIVPPAATVLLLSTVAWSLHRLRQKRLSLMARTALLGFWLVAPPLWFSYEYFHLYQSNVVKCGLGPAEWEQFKYGQESAGKIWAAIVVFLGALYFKGTGPGTD